MRDWVTIKDASADSGLTVDTIRYYERVGVLPPVTRTPNRYRGYTAAHVETLRFARSLRDLGLPVAEMALLVKVFHDGTCKDMQAVLVSRARDALARVMAQKSALERTEKNLRALLDDIEGIAGDSRRVSGLTPCACVAALDQETFRVPAPNGGEP